MNPKVTIEYSRTDDDYQAEKASEEAAMHGKWAEFANVAAEVDSPVNDIAGDAVAKRYNDRHDFANKLAANGWPNGMLHIAVDRHYPVK